MNKTRLYVTIGVIVGFLVGFVFALAYGTSEKSLQSAGKAKGNVSELSRYRYGNKDAGFQEAQTEKASSDTLRYTVTDANGETWTLTIDKQ